MAMLMSNRVLARLVNSRFGDLVVGVYDGGLGEGRYGVYVARGRKILHSDPEGIREVEYVTKEGGWYVYRTVEALEKRLSEVKWKEILEDPQTDYTFGYFQDGSQFLCENVYFDLKNVLQLKEGYLAGGGRMRYEGYRPDAPFVY